MSYHASGTSSARARDNSTVASNNLPEETEVQVAGVEMVVEADGKPTNTQSCPCSSKPVTLSTGGVGCENDSFGIITTIAAISIQKHLIGSEQPRVGDRWRCIGVACKEGDWEWNTLYVVGVKENLTTSNTSYFNSTVSNANCFIPKSQWINNNSKILWDEQTLKNLSQDGSGNGNEDGALTVPNGGYNIYDTLGEVNNKPIFATKDQAWWYNLVNDISDDPGAYVEYNKDGLVGYVPGISTGTEKLINSIVINGLNISKKIDNQFSTIDDNPSEARKNTLKAQGDFIDIDINGLNAPTITLVIKDSTDCNIIKEKIINKVIYGAQKIKVAVPPLLVGQKNETYTIEISTGADCGFDTGDGSLSVGVVKMKMYQYSNSVFTIKNAASSISSTATTTTTKSIIGDALSKPESFAVQVHETTVTRNSGTTPLYVKPISNYGDIVSKRNVIKKSVRIEKRKNSVFTNTIELFPTLTVDPDDATKYLYSGEVLIGMKFSSKIVKTKRVKNSVDLDIHKQPCDDCDDDIYTDTFNIFNNPNDIFEGMMVTGIDSTGREFESELIKINSAKAESCIVINSKHIIDKETVLTFTYYSSGHVSNVSAGDKEIITLDKDIYINKESVLDFETQNVSSIDTTILTSVAPNSPGSITIKTVINNVSFGNEDVTFDIATDSIVTDKPNAYDQHLVISRGVKTIFDFVKNDYDIGKESKAITITSPPKKGVVNVAPVIDGVADSIGFHEYTSLVAGKDKIRFTVSDGAVSSDEKIIFITVK